MKIQSAWSRGVLYAAIVGLLVLLAVVAVGLIGGESIGNTLQAAGIGLALWGGVGFLLGYFGHGEVSAQSHVCTVTQTSFSLIRRWSYRVIAGLILGYVAGAVVEGLQIAFVIAMYGGLDEFLKQRTRLPHELRFELIGFSVMICSATAATLGGFLGVMLAPLRYNSRLLIRSSTMAAALGSLAGAWVGGSVGVLYPEYLESNHVFVLAIIGGAFAGVGASLLLRLRVNR